MRIPSHREAELRHTLYKDTAYWSLRRGRVDSFFRTSYLGPQEKHCAPPQKPDVGELAGDNNRSVRQANFGAALDYLRFRQPKCNPPQGGFCIWGFVIADLIRNPGAPPSAATRSYWRST
jgi:hypothetical protein